MISARQKLVTFLVPIGAKSGCTPLRTYATLLKDGIVAEFILAITASGFEFGDGYRTATSEYFILTNL